MAVTAMNHFTVLTDDVEATVRFYRDVVGLAQGPRPPLGFPGAWLYTGNQAVLHVVGGRQRANSGRASSTTWRFPRRGSLCGRDARRERCGVPMSAAGGLRCVAGVLPRPQRREDRARFRARGTGAAMTPGAPPAATLDHLVVAATTLADGIDYIAEIAGVTPQPGGKHAAMGTHNALVRLSERTYLEIIAIDPAGAPPSRPRWFGLDGIALQAELTERPRLIHWVARATELRAAPRCARSRSARCTRCRAEIFLANHDPDDGTLPGKGIVPTLIEWDVPQHPADRSRSRICRSPVLRRRIPIRPHPRGAGGAGARRRAARHVRPRAAARRDAAHAARHRHALMAAPEKSRAVSRAHPAPRPATRTRRAPPRTPTIQS